MRNSVLTRALVACGAAVTAAACAAVTTTLLPAPLAAQARSGQGAARASTPGVDAAVERVMPKVIAWRRDLHEHPELSNREVRTSGIVAEQLKSLGIEVRTGVAKTGVVGVLKGGKPGPVVALRADMDALPVTEEVDLPFASKVRSSYNGQEVGVMHACGHDAHVAMLLGAAEVLAGMKADLPGTVVFLFQPAEEGAPPGEVGGASVMVAEGALANPEVDAVFGLHVFSTLPTGVIGYRAGGLMAASDQMRIVVRGSQTHGAMPWAGVDPIVVSSQVVTALQTIVSRQVDVTLAPAVVTVGLMRGGTRFNIVPDSVVMEGTIRTFDPAMQREIHERVRRTAQKVAEASGATAEVTIAESGNPVTYNDPALTERMLPTLRRTAGEGKVVVAQQTTTAEDFSHYQKQVPGLFLFLGVVPEGKEPKTAAPNHSPRFEVDEAALPTGVKTLVGLATDYLAGGR